MTRSVQERLAHVVANAMAADADARGDDSMSWIDEIPEPVWQWLP